MQILDEDMQMVHDFLKVWGAPEYVKGHFENLVSEHAKEADNAATLKERVDELEAEAEDCDDLKQQVAALQEEVDERNSDQDSALETVKYWLHDVLFLKRPMQKPPWEILRIVEEAL